MGVRQQFKMEKFDWYVTVYYTIDNIQKMELMEELIKIGCDKDSLKAITANLSKAKKDTGFTYSSFSNQCSVIVIHKASSVGEFVNTFEHEKNHLMMHICEAFDINPYSEEAAILSGELTMQIVNEALCKIVEL